MTSTQQTDMNSPLAMSVLFDAILQAILDFSPFDPNWEVVEGDFSGVTNAIMKPGEIIKTEAPDGRRLIVVGTPIGCVAIVEGTHDSADKFSVSILAPQALAFMLAVGKPVGHEEFLLVVGKARFENIGFRLQHLEMVMGVHQRVKTRVQERLEEAQALSGTNVNRGQLLVDLPGILRAQRGRHSVVEEHEHRLYAHITGYQPK